jgi:hypothetical protein
VQRTARIIQIDEDEAEPSCAQHVLGRLQCLPEIGRAHPEQSIDVYPGMMSMSGIEGVWQIDAGSEITTGGDSGDDGIGQCRSPRRPGPHQLCYDTSWKPTREQPIEINQACRDLGGMRLCLETAE